MIDSVKIPELHNEEDYDPQRSPHIWEDDKEKINVTFKFEEYVEADDKLKQKIIFAVYSNALIFNYMLHTQP
jgi:hypothetical protein